MSLHLLMLIDILDQYWWKSNLIWLDGKVSLDQKKALYVLKEYEIINDLFKNAVKELNKEICMNFYKYVLFFLPANQLKN